MTELLTVKEVEAMLARAKKYESAYYRLLQAAEEIEGHGYTVKIEIREADNVS